MTTLTPRYVLNSAAPAYLSMNNPLMQILKFIPAYQLEMNMCCCLADVSARFPELDCSYYVDLLTQQGKIFSHALQLAISYEGQQTLDAISYEGQQTLDRAEGLQQMVTGSIAIHSDDPENIARLLNYMWCNKIPFNYAGNIEGLTYGYANRHKTTYPAFFSQWLPAPTAERFNKGRKPKRK